jgi:16S rRNA processing protein RimM
MCSEKICLGVIIAPHGVRGMVRVKPFTEHPQDIAAYGAVQLDDGRQADLSIHGVNKGLVLVQIVGVSNRGEAEALKGGRIHIARSQLPEVAADEIYQADLIGLDLLDPDQGRIGTITAVFDFGGGAILEVESLAKETVLVPFGGVNPIEITAREVHLTVDPIWLKEETKPDEKS